MRVTREEACNLIDLGKRGDLVELGVSSYRSHTWVAKASDSRVESTSQSLKNEVESTSHTWSL